jgi:molybdopterin/thiamine biosynthesis adenylyltransferase
MRELPAEVGAPTFEGKIAVDSSEYWLRLTLPPGYPSVPPELREIDGPGGAVRIRPGTLFRFEDGSMCLFPHGRDPQAWHRDRLAVEALDKFSALARDDQARAEGRGALLFRDSRTVYVAEAIAGWLRWPGGRGTLSLRVAPTGAGDLFADAVDIFGESAGATNVLGAAWSIALPLLCHVPWVRVPLAGQRWEDVAATRSHLDALLAAALPTAVFEQLRREESVVLVRAEEDADDPRLDAVLIGRPSAHLQALHLASVKVAHPQQRLFHRADGVLRSRTSLQGARVVIVGLGSLGGAVALALARAGIQRFVLIDPDRLSVDNICRHVGSISDLGRLKSEVIEEMLATINPEVEVTSIPKWLAWDLPWIGAGRELEQMLTETGRTVVIMTCAAHQAERQLNALAVESGVTVIYASALGAAEHGRIFRVIPQETACYECILAAQEAEPGSFPRFIRGAPGGERVAYLQPGLPGLGIDITQIAMITSRFALQTIARLERMDLGFADEPGDHLLWTNRGGWIFDRPLQLMVEHIPRSPSCPVCGQGGHQAE